MPWFVLPDNRIVGGGIQVISKEMATDKYPAGEWVCWRELRRSLSGPPNGRTPVEYVIVLDMDQGLPSPTGIVHRPCAECDAEGHCESHDFICVFCRYQNGKS
jgi:hypothetical protein